MKPQPISTVHWVDRDELVANNWNPNRVFRPELELLHRSMIEDGWTQPIVARQQEDGRYEIIDGFHRWTLAEEPDIRDLTGGLVPIVLVDTDHAHSRISTVRHNRARGSHYVNLMASIVCELSDMGLTEAELIDELGMEAEEVRRLAAHGDILARVGGEQMGEAWRSAPKHKAVKQ